MTGNGNGVPLAMPEENRKRSSVILFADNTSSVASITNEKQVSQTFVENATNFPTRTEGQA